MQATRPQKDFLRRLKSQHPNAWRALVGNREHDSLSFHEASNAIDAIKAYVVYNPGSQRATIAEAIRGNRGSVSRTITEILPRVGQRPLVWSKNVAGQRVPLPVYEQKERMRQTVAEVAAELTSHPAPPPVTSDTGESSESSAGESGQDSDGQGSDGEPDWMEEIREAMGDSSESDSEGDSGESESESESDEQDESQMTEEERKEAHSKRFLQFVRKARDYWKTRNADGITAESVGMRPALNGAKMLRAGIPVQSVIHAMAIHWADGTIDEIESVKARDKAAKPDASEFPATAFAQEEVKPLSERIGESVHRCLPYILRLAKARIPIALIGTHGTGKTEIARQLAKALDLQFGFASMTEGTPPSTFYGRVFPEPVQSVFEDCFENGGVFLFDEMDAAHPNLLLIVNAALANGEFSNTATGRVVQRHPDFIPVCAMNTTGFGADRNYAGRRRLDAASLDRWHMGRVQVPIDEALEEALYGAILADTTDEIPEDEKPVPHSPTAEELEEIFAA